MTIKRIDLDEIDSTNNYAKIHNSELENMTFIFANKQTNGHGRMNREWDSGDGNNMLLSLFVKENELINRFESMSIFFAVTIYKLLDSFGLKNINIKWPNDVFVDDEKIAGILLEGSIPKYLIIGIGLNVNEKQLKFDTSTSMVNSLKHEIPLNELKEKYIEIVKNELTDFKKDNSDYLQIANSHNYLLDKEIVFEYQNNFLSGIAKQIDPDNKLVIQTKEKIIRVNYGEITLKK